MQHVALQILMPVSQNVRRGAIICQNALTIVGTKRMRAAQQRAAIEMTRCHSGAKSARELRLSVPNSMQLLADELIEYG